MGCDEDAMYHQYDPTSLIGYLFMNAMPIPPTDLESEDPSHAGISLECIAQTSLAFKIRRSLRQPTCVILSTFDVMLVTLYKHMLVDCCCTTNPNQHTGIP